VQGSANNIVNLPEIIQRDGMLEFATQKDFYAAINAFGKMSSEDRITWGLQNNFKTQQIIFDKICKAEDEFDAVYYAGIPETAKEEDLAKLGKVIAFSDMYIKYLNDDFIKQTVSDSEYSFYLNTLNRTASTVLNKAGMCLVNDTLYYYNNDSKKLIQKKYNSSNDIEDIKRLETSTADCECNVFDLNTDRADTYFFIDNIWTQSGLDQELQWTWYYDSANERFRHYVRMASAIDNYTLFVDYATYSVAEYKRKKKWKKKWKYRPIDFLEGKWDYWYGEYTNGAVWNSLDELSGGFPAGYYNNPNWMKNEIGNNLSPAGSYNLTDANEPIHIENMHIHGYFIGSTGNYHTNYFH